MKAIKNMQSSLWHSLAITAMTVIGIAASPISCSQDMTPITEFEVGSHARDWRGEIIYQLIVDRFEDGDINNNQGVRPGELGRYQGGDWQGIIDRIPYLQELGVTALWISPVIRNVESDAGFDGYHGYWAQDFLDTNPHFGDLAKLRELVDALHEADILILFDIVTNHVGQVFYYDINMNGQPDEAVYGTGVNSPLQRVSEWDPDYDGRGVQAFTSLGEAGPAPIRWVTIPELNRGPPEPSEFANPDWYWQRGRVTVWGREMEACSQHFGRAAPDGVGWWGNWPECHAYVREQEMTGDFPGGLKDLRTELPEVRQALMRVMAYWIEAADIDGFRIDTVKHVEADFWTEFASTMRQVALDLGKEDFFMFGEAFDGQDELLGSYTEPGMLDSVFYFSQKFQVFDNVFIYGQGTAQIERLWDARYENYSTIPQPNGVTDAAGNGIAPTQLLVNFIDNHDVARFLFNVQDDPQGLERLHAALTMLLTEDGIPCIYYGTEQQFAGGNDPANRAPLWYTDFDTSNPTFQFISTLTHMRQEYPELSFGRLHVTYSTEHTGDESDAGMFGFERRFEGDTALVLFNTNAAHPSRSSFENATMPTTFAPGTELIDISPAGSCERFNVTATGCDVSSCTDPVADDAPDIACGCLDLEVAPLLSRILVDSSRGGTTCGR